MAKKEISLNDPDYEVALIGKLITDVQKVGKNLLPEILWTAFQFIKDNPDASIDEAIGYSYGRYCE